MTNYPVKCPKCGKDDSVVVDCIIKAWATLAPRSADEDFSDTQYAEFEINDTSRCACGHCGMTNFYKHFKVEAVRDPLPDTEVNQIRVAPHKLTMFKLVVDAQLGRYALQRLDTVSGEVRTTSWRGGDDGRQWAAGLMSCDYDDFINAAQKAIFT